MRPFLPLLCLLAATLTPGAHADTLFDVTVYSSAAVVDPDPTRPIELPPAELLDQTISFTLPEYPDVPPLPPVDPEFSVFPDAGFTLHNVPITVQNLRPATAPVHAVADIFDFYDALYIAVDGQAIFDAHTSVWYELTADREPHLITPVPGQGYAYNAYVGGGSVGFLTVIPRSDNTPSPVPEPATLTLLATGALGLAATRRRKKRNGPGE